MATDYGVEITKELESLGTINSVEDICEVWSKIRPILVTAQSILKFLYPPAATAIGIIISLFDNLCPGSGSATAITGTSEAASLLKAQEEMIAAWKPEANGGCQSSCKAQYDRDVARCGDNLDCITAAMGRYIICMKGCRKPSPK